MLESWNRLRWLQEKILRTGENRMLAHVLNDIVTYFHIRKQQKKTKGDILSL